MDIKSELHNDPLVTVGIPTYNRPEGLRRTLECVTAQTYRHLEIIVADNASPDPDVAAIAQEYASKDSRITFCRHETNLGIFANFSFVLQRATGPLFMWWADDDERTPDAIEYYVVNIGNSGGFFSTYAIRDYDAMSDTEVKISLFTGMPRTKSEITLFFKQMHPPMLYGLLRTDAVRDCWSGAGYDWLDCNILLKLIANYGFKTLRSEPKFFLGVHGRYVAKPANGKVVDPWPFFFRSFPLAVRGGIRASDVTSSL